MALSTTASFMTDRVAIPGRVRTAAFAGGVVLAEIAAGMMLVDPRFSRLALLPFAAAGMALVFAFPFAATIGLLVATASIIPAAVFAIGLGPIDLGRAAPWPPSWRSSRSRESWPSARDVSASARRSAPRARSACSCSSTSSSGCFPTRATCTGS
jgi:hypothetical protein